MPMTRADLARNRLRLAAWIYEILPSLAGEMPAGMRWGTP